MGTTLRKSGPGTLIGLALLGLAAGPALAGGSLEPPGPPGVTMKTLDEVQPRTPISSLPFTISQPGSYYLTGNLTGVFSSNGITIDASGVTLDLMGFSLTGAVGSGDAIRVNNFRNEIVIRNGLIQQWSGYGIRAPNSADCQFQDLILFLNGAMGIQAGDGALVSRCTLNANGGGISVNQRGQVTGCIVLQSAASNFPSIEANTASTVRGCTVAVSAGPGIRVHELCHVVGNDVSQGQGIGIYVINSGSRVEDNHVTNNGVGIQVDSSPNLIIKNSGSGNTVEYNIATGNKVGPISTDPATAGPWANFDF
jgi:parallel beta-helix repeat protein